MIFDTINDFHLGHGNIFHCPEDIIVFKTKKKAQRYINILKDSIEYHKGKGTLLPKPGRW